MTDVAGVRITPEEMPYVLAIVILALTSDTPPSDLMANAARAIAWAAIGLPEPEGGEPL